MSNIYYAKADIVWTDTFDDSSSFDNWWISHGNFTVEDGTLKGSDGGWYDSGSNEYWDILWKNHTAITGTWSLDVNFDEGDILFFYFMGLDETFDGSHPEYGYILIVNAKIDVNRVN